MSLKTINFPLHWSSEQREEFLNATHCHICGIKFMEHPDNKFCYVTIKNPHFDEEMKEYNRRKKEMNDEQKL